MRIPVVLSVAVIQLSLSLAISTNFAATAARSADELSFARTALLENKVNAGTFDKLAEIIKRNPANAEARTVLGKCYDAVGMSGMSKDQLDEASRLDPDGPSAKLAKFKSQFNSANPGQSFTLFMEIQTLFPHDRDVELMDEIISETYGNVQRAETAYLANYSHRTLPQIATALSKHRQEQHRYKEALQLAEADLKIDPDDMEAMVAKSGALIGLGRYEEAEHTAAPVFENWQSHFGAAYNLAVACDFDQRSQAALRPALFAVAFARTEAEKNKSEQLAASLMRKVPAYYSDAVTIECSNIIDRLPPAAEFHYILGGIYSKFGQHNQARYEYQRAVEFDSTKAQYLFALGMVDERQAKFRDAISAYAGAHLLEPQNELFTTSWTRLMQRMRNKENDLAWRMKEAMHKQVK